MLGIISLSLQRVIDENKLLKSDTSMENFVAGAKTKSHILAQKFVLLPHHNTFVLTRWVAAVKNIRHCMHRQSSTSFFICIVFQINFTITVMVKIMFVPKNAYGL